jgi:hypothetical protein
MVTRNRNYVIKYNTFFLHYVTTQRLQVHVLGNSKIAGSLAVRGSDMFCDICVNSQIVNSFTTGCDIMKKEVTWISGTKAKCWQLQMLTTWLT